MTNSLIVNVTSYETRVALLNKGIATELYIEKNKDKGIVGNIYIGRVQRVLPGMQAAFVDIGLDKAAFLFVGDAVAPSELPQEELIKHKEQHESNIDLDVGLNIYKEKPTC